MNGKILLIEPGYNNKYPPVGLMKIAYFHKHILHDYVRFTKGKLPEALSKTKWDHVYVTSLFTYEWATTIDSIKYALTLVNSPEQVTVGGIAATLMPALIFRETGVQPVCGLLNEPGKLGLYGDECIDQLIPDYSILDDISDKYVYPYHDAYFLSATKGCGMRCGFCAVQTLEPNYIPYMDIKDKIDEIDEKFGPKRNLLLMDNNVLRSNNFAQIIEDIVRVGFGRSATFVNKKTGKQVRRYVDFNQGLDGNLLTPDKAELLGRIALRPARIAFDHIEDQATYERAIRLCAVNGNTELSNYLLYNSEDFSGKGKSYQADTPADLYNRMRFSLDLKEDINCQLPDNQKISIFSFPMRYIPLSARERGYVGSNWNAKFLRAVQCMLIPTQGKGVGNTSFFEADFGRDAAEFERFLCMPEKLIAARGNFIIGGRGRADETENERSVRRAIWEKNQKRIAEWNRIFTLLCEERGEFIDQIGDNEFRPEKVLGLRTGLQKKIYLHYLTEPRILSLLGIVDKSSPTHKLLADYIRFEFPLMYESLVALIAKLGVQQKYMFNNFVSYFGNSGVQDILEQLEKTDFDADKQMAIWAKSSRKSLMLRIDFDLVRVYRRFVELNVFNEQDHKKAHQCILKQHMAELGQILNENMFRFEEKVQLYIDSESGISLIHQITKMIMKNIQLKIADVMSEEL